MQEDTSPWSLVVPSVTLSLTAHCVQLQIWSGQGNRSVSIFLSSLDNSNYPFPEQKLVKLDPQYQTKVKGKQPKSRHNILTSTITTPSLIRFSSPFQNPVANGVGELRMGGLPHQTKAYPDISHRNLWIAMEILWHRIGTSMDTCGHIGFPLAQKKNAVVHNDNITALGFGSTAHQVAPSLKRMFRCSTVFHPYTFSGLWLMDVDGCWWK